MHDLEHEQAVMDQLVGLPVAEVERDLILATLRETDGNRTHAANLLGIAIRTLRNKINLYAAEGYDVPEPPQSAAS
ncbi:DNA-binding NtrC family response regulator [Bosea sp. OAE752]|jgi:DNA-binding NtrC family response regulator|uniref:helix-turn-helix domain-containing protein n=1 Tax=unclassified Bosea (in: a-proteobacteria) TaxID=2653178 RepID=UPI00114FF756